MAHVLVCDNFISYRRFSPPAAKAGAKGGAEHTSSGDTSRHLGIYTEKPHS